MICSYYAYRDTIDFIPHLVTVKVYSLIVLNVSSAIPENFSIPLPLRLRLTLPFLPHLFAFLQIASSSPGCSFEWPPGLSLYIFISRSSTLALDLNLALA